MSQSVTPWTVSGKCQPPTSPIPVATNPYSQPNEWALYKSATGYGSMSPFFGLSVRCLSLSTCGGRCPATLRGSNRPYSTSGSMSCAVIRGTCVVGMNALRWLVPDHDTSFVRQLAEDLRKGNSGLFCVWTGRRLSRSYDIDHCFPFAAWPCNDLWNLLPSYPATNRRKGDQLPTRHALREAEPRILDWWDRAYGREPSITRRFIDESQSALPMAVSESGTVTLESVFEGVTFQQMVLSRDQQLSEWQPKPPEP